MCFSTFLSYAMHGVCNARMGLVRREQVVVAAVLCLAGAIALAQEDDDAAPAPSAKDIEEIVVVGTGTNISGVAAVGSESIVMDREQILATGASNVADAVRTLPQVSKLGLSEESRGNNAVDGFATRGSTINLRGIGDNATLLLVDGHRLTPAGTATAFLEAVQVPLAAVERVEVIADGSSAIYGSDAVAGVVNFILNKKFEGIQLGVRYGDNRYGDDWAIDGIAGTSWNGLGSLGSGNIVISAEYDQQNPILRGDIPGFRQDLRRFGGIDNRLIGNSATPGMPGNIVVPTVDPDGPTGPLPAPNNPDIPEAQTYTYWGLPAGTDGVGLSASDLLLNQPNLVDRSDYEDYRPDTTRKFLTLFLEQHITDSTSVFLQGFYSRRNTVTRTFFSQNAQGNPLFDVPASNPYYISGIPDVTPGDPITVQYNIHDHVTPNGGDFVNENYENTLSITAGAKSSLAGGWYGEFYGTYGQVENCGVCYLGNFVNGDDGNALQQAIASGAINPFSSEPLTRDQVDLIVGDNIQLAQNYFTDMVLKFDGPLFDIGDRSVKGAVGIEYAHLTSQLQNGANRPPFNEFLWDADASKERRQKSMFAELYLPLADSLEVSLAARYDDYSDFGSTTNPKIGITWAVSDSFTVRGSWGTSFRAPGVPDLNAGVFSVAIGPFPFPNNSGRTDIGQLFFPGSGLSNTVLRLGGNPNLVPEEGETRTVGVEIAPSSIDGLKVSTTYYQIDYKNRITGLNFNVFLANPENAQIYDPYIVPIPPADAGCTPGDVSTYPAELQPFVTDFLYGAIFDPCAVQVVLDARFTNASSTKQEGFDFQFTYDWQTNAGLWSVGANVNKILKNDEVLVKGTPVVDSLDRIFFPVSLRARGNVSWFYKRMTANLFANYVGGYTNDVPISIEGVQQPNSEVPSWTTLDLNLAYTFGFGSPNDNVMVGLNVRNLLDRDPPVVLTGQTAIDARNHDPFGRTYQVNVNVRF